MLDIVFNDALPCLYEQKTGKDKVNVDFWVKSSKLVHQELSNSYKISVLRHYNLVGVFVCLKNINNAQKCFIYVNKDSDLEAIKLSQYLLEKVKNMSLKGMN